MSNEFSGNRFIDGDKSGCKLICPPVLTVSPYTDFRKILRILEIIPLNSHRFCENMCSESYVVGYKSFRPDIQKPRQTENAVRDI